MLQVTEKIVVLERRDGEDQAIEGRRDDSDDSPVSTSIRERPHPFR
jgi:hypothetical protein